MAILGVLLLAVVALAVLSALLRGGDAVTIDLEWFTIRTEAGVVFFAGVLTLLIFLLGGWILTKGLKRGRRRRSEVKGLRRRAEASDEAARGERQSVAPTSGAPPSSEASRRHDGPDEYFDTAPRER